MQNMDYMFLCPQGETVYRDNPKVGGGEHPFLSSSLAQLAAKGDLANAGGSLVERQSAATRQSLIQPSDQGQARKMPWA